MNSVRFRCVLIIVYGFCWGCMNSCIKESSHFFFGFHFYNVLSSISQLYAYVLANSLCCSFRAYLCSTCNVLSTVFWVCGFVLIGPELSVSLTGHSGQNWYTYMRRWGDWLATKVVMLLQNYHHDIMPLGMHFGLWCGGGVFLALSCDTWLSGTVVFATTWSNSILSSCSTPLHGLALLK